VFQWGCIFYPDNAAYYINQMLLMALFGCSLTLLRWKNLISQFIIALKSRSWSEIRARRNLMLIVEYQFDGDMADFLVSFF
jgi:hypothetical protein